MERKKTWPWLNEYVISFYWTSNGERRYNDKTWNDRSSYRVPYDLWYSPKTWTDLEEKLFSLSVEDSSVEFHFTKANLIRTFWNLYKGIWMLNLSFSAMATDENLCISNFLPCLGEKASPNILPAICYQFWFVSSIYGTIYSIVNHPVPVYQET